jgi:hypothetical protein
MPSSKVGSQFSNKYRVSKPKKKPAHNSSVRKARPCAKTARKPDWQANCNGPLGGDRSLEILRLAQMRGHDWRNDERSYAADDEQLPPVDRNP